MRRAQFVVLAVVLLAGFGSAHPPRAGTPPGAATRSGEMRVLMLVCRDYGANYNLIRDAKELRGWQVTVATTRTTCRPCPWSETLGATGMAGDLLIDDLPDITPYDVLAIMPATATTGTSHQQMLESPAALQLVASAVAGDLVVAAFCGGTRVLAAADVIQGRRVTGHPTYQAEYVAAGAEFVETTPPLLDGNILTSRRGQFYCHQVCDVMAAAVDSIRAARSGR